MWVRRRNELPLYLSWLCALEEELVANDNQSERRAYLWVPARGLGLVANHCGFGDAPRSGRLYCRLKALGANRELGKVS